jgi:hypothetical protein
MSGHQQASLDEVARLRQQLAALEARVAAPDRAPNLRALAEYQDAHARADSVYQELGLHAPPPHDGEGLLDYKTRLVKRLQQFSPKWKDENLRMMADAVVINPKSTAFSNAEAQIYADAQVYAADPTVGDLRNPGRLREVHKRDQGGTVITEFHGDSGICWAPFISQGQAVKMFNYDAATGERVAGAARRS